MAKTKNGRQQDVQRPSNKDQRKLLEKAEAAGWRIEASRSGWRVLAPDGVGIVHLHGSSSDHRAIQNMRADFRRAGLDLDAL